MKLAIIELHVTEERLAEFDEVMKATQITTRSDLFNNVLTLFEWAVGEKKKGNIIVSFDSVNETYQQIVMPVLEAVDKNDPEEENTTELVKEIFEPALELKAQET